MTITYFLWEYSDIIQKKFLKNPRFNNLGRLGSNVHPDIDVLSRQSTQLKGQRDDRKMWKSTYFSNSIALSDFFIFIVDNVIDRQVCYKRIKWKKRIKGREIFDDLISFNIISPSMLSNTGLLREMRISDINYFYDNTNTTVKQFYAPITVTYFIYLFFWYF